MVGGRRSVDGRVTLDAARSRSARELDRLPARIRGLNPSDPPYAVEVSAALAHERDVLRSSRS